ncbi:MAG: ABC transporter substrate-binding protein [Azoarcus sp.]|jgi:sulfonate transport system substrate-binding protein|nr:ABC transporter substrate-binding protein [Azoarcus sp.]
MERRDFLKIACAAGLLSGCGDGGVPAVGAAEELPRRIRLAPHGAWGSAKATGLMGIVQSQGLLEQEFDQDGVAIDWTPMDGGGIHINEAIANGMIDVSSFGAMPLIIGRARGIRTRLLASQGFHYSYLGVRAGLAARTPGDLVGASFAILLGGWSHLSTAQLLHEHGVSLSAVKLVNMSAQEANAAIATGQIDATLVSGPSLFPLEAQGLVRIIHVTRGRRTGSSGFGALFVTEDFARRYPGVPRRIVRAYLRAVHWAGLPENRDAYFEYNTQASTVPKEYLERDFAGRDLRDAFVPLLDDYIVARFARAAAFCHDNKIIRAPVSIDDWFDRAPIAWALADLGLENFWPAWSADGEVQTPVAQTSTR